MTGSVAGIDWASEKHDVLIAAADGERLLGETFAHDEPGITALCDALRCFEVELVAIERGDGVVGRAVARGWGRVLALHPNQVKAAPGPGSSGAAGRTAPRITLPDTPDCNSISS